MNRDFAFYEYVLYRTLMILFLPFLLIIFGIIQISFSFIWHNFLVFILFLFAFKIEQKKRMVLSIVLLLGVLVNYYFKDQTNNLIALVLFYAINSNHNNRKIMAVLLAAFLLFYGNIRAMFFQVLSGEKTFIQTSFNNPTPHLVPNSGDKKIEIKNGNFDVIFTPVMDAEINARVVYIDEYDKIFSFEDYYSHPLYDFLAPIDVTVFIKSMADNWQKFPVMHEQRVAFVRRTNENSSLYKIDEWSNLHIIPKNKTVRNGFKTLQKGDVVKIKGYLVDWQGLGQYDYFKIQTARDFDDVSEQRIGGQLSFLCMQVYVTELYANGYVFK